MKPLAAHDVRLASANPSTYEFFFNKSLNAIGIDISDVDRKSGELMILDENDNVLLSFTSDSDGPQDIFFGLINTQAYSSIRIVAAGDSNDTWGGVWWSTDGM